MNLDNYRSSSEYREILRILQKASSLQENFVWQSLSQSKVIIPIHHFEIDFVAREVVIYYDAQEQGLQEKLPLYVKLDYRTSVFKVSEYRQGPNTLHFPFPKEIKTQELRTAPRYGFNPSHNKHVSLKASMKGQELSEINVRVVDASYFGLGLILSENNRAFIKNNRILWITKLQDEPLSYPILAEVIYITSGSETSESGRKNKILKVGLKLSGVFPEKEFVDFIQ